MLDFHKKSLNLTYVDSGLQVIEEEVAALTSWKDHLWKFNNTPV